jgi:hypothetical protein
MWSCTRQKHYAFLFIFDDDFSLYLFSTFNTGGLNTISISRGTFRLSLKLKLNGISISLQHNISYFYYYYSYYNNIISKTKKAY